MRFYQLETKKKPEDPTEGGPTFNIKTYWHGTERDAIIERSKLFQAGGLVGLKREQMIFPVDVPTDKAGLLKFLQDNVTAPVVL